MIFLLLFYHLSNLCSASLPVPCTLPATAILLLASCHSFIFFPVILPSTFLTILYYALIPALSLPAPLPLSLSFSLVFRSLINSVSPNFRYHQKRKSPIVNKILITKNCRILVFNNLFSHTIDFIKKL